MSDLPLTPGGSAQDELFRPRLALRRALGAAFQVACILLSLVAVVVLAALLVQIARQGWPLLSWRFLWNLPSQLMPETSGVWPALAGTLWLMVLTTITAIPLGVGAAAWLEEFAPRNRLTRLISLNIENLAGVPSIVYGILGLAVFVRWFTLERSVLSGAFTLSLLILPVIIIASREALRAVPNTIREAAFGLGATRWQCVRYHVLPAALPGIMTGVILSLSRAIGEAAPLIMIGAVSFVSIVPDFGAYTTPPEDQAGGPAYVAEGAYYWVKDWLTGDFTAMPIQIFVWAGEAHEEFHTLAGAAIIVLLAILLTMNGIAVGIRAWHQRTRPW